MLVSRREMFYLLTLFQPNHGFSCDLYYSLHGADKADIPAGCREIHKYRFYELCDQFADYCRIYTDGSKAGERVASAIVYKGITKSVRLPDLTSIFRAELYAFSGNRCHSPVKVEQIRNFLRFAI